MFSILFSVVNGAEFVLSDSKSGFRFLQKLPYQDIFNVRANSIQLQNFLVNKFISEQFDAVSYCSLTLILSWQPIFHKLFFCFVLFVFYQKIPYVLLTFRLISALS